MAEIVKDSTVYGLSRANDKDISRAAEAIKPAKSGRIHTFIATRPIHMEKKLRMTPDQVLERAIRRVSARAQFTDDVEFSPEDAGRSGCRLFVPRARGGDRARARTVNIPDTVGYTLPEKFGAR